METNLNNMTTILISFNCKNGNEVIEPWMDHFFDQIDLDFIKRAVTRNLLKMIGNDVNGEFFVTFKEWLEDVQEFQETPRMVENRIELNQQAFKIAFEKFEIINI